MGKALKFIQLKGLEVIGSDNFLDLGLHCCKNLFYHTNRYPKSEEKLGCYNLARQIT